MSSTFGNQTIEFVSVDPVAGAEQDELGTRQLTGLNTDTPGTPVYGCRHRPLSPGGQGSREARAEQEPEVNVSVATSWWQTTAPPAPAVLAAKPADMLRDENGDLFQIISGIQIFPDGNGAPFKVTILSEKQTIG
jgi:hypothetical protein